MARTASLLAAALLPTCALGHGYVQTPASRGWGCMRNNEQLRNTGCGQVQWEAWSVEGNDGSPRYPAQAADGIPDGRIASANRPRGRWAQLDEQSATRWDKVQLRSGLNEFRWGFNAPHATRDYRYWITKVGWNPNAPLARATFEAEPFCTVSLGGAMATSNANHMCNVPTRSGYHIILAIWDVSDTDQSFYNVIDAIIDGTAAPPTSAAPTTATDAPACAATVGRWGNCHHVGGCCADNWVCVRKSQWYSQCLPPDQAPTPTTPTTPPTPPPTTRPTPATTTTTTAVPVTTTATPTTTAAPAPTTTTTPDECRAYESCTNNAGCCQAGFECVALCDSYSQCRPSSTLPPAPAGCAAAVPEYGACAQARGCCVSWTMCVEVTPHFAQCLRPFAP